MKKKQPTTDDVIIETGSLATFYTYLYVYNTYRWAQHVNILLLILYIYIRHMLYIYIRRTANEKIISR